MENRNTGIIVTVITAICCGCPGLFSCLSGGLTAAGFGTYTVDLPGYASGGQTPQVYGIVSLCLGLLLVLIPVAVGFFTLRKKPGVENIDEPVPPAS